MPETRQITLFGIRELSDEAQDKAVDQLRDDQYCAVEPSVITDGFAETLKEFGMPTDDIEWRLSYCQGDGVAFYGNIDVEQMLKGIGEWDEWREFVSRHGISAVIKRNSWGTHYSHWNTMDVYMEREFGYDVGFQTAAGKRLWELIKLKVVSLSKELEKEGYDLINEHQEKEYIMDVADCNDLLFTKEGHLWTFQ